MSARHPANRLAHEKSPYLLQHAHNPVDWYPWGEEAFERARREDKPIFLSIGYSTCHWCHVMERESFEDEAIAAQLNSDYVSIKVDREERPDVDHVYMTAVQALTGAGGWPLSAWLLPDLRPFYAGTYFPPDARYGRPGFPDVLQQLTRAYRADRERVVEAAAEITRALRAHTAPTPAAGVDAPAALQRGADQFASSYDREHGGFGAAPKFPRPSGLLFLLRHGSRAAGGTAQTMALDTLRAMSAGGINDQLGGGFHRYSVDTYWRVPHFEKMLYDQAQLVWALLDAGALSGDAAMAREAERVLDYVARELTHGGGGFFSAEDADSAADPSRPAERTEGAFYLWQRSEIESLLPPGDAAVACSVWGVSATGNTLHDPHGDFGTGNVLHRARTELQAAHELGVEPAAIVGATERAGRELLSARARRPRPHRDEKIVTAWNGLMISAAARAAQALGRPQDLRAAQRAAHFVLAHNLDADHRLNRRWCDGQAAHPAQLSDYAGLILGLHDLYEADLDPGWLLHAERLADTLIARYRDLEHGGFFDTAGDDPSVLVRGKEVHDGAEPSGNALAALALLRLGHALDRPDLARAAAGTALSLGRVLLVRPEAAPFLLCALDLLERGPAQVIVVGKAGDPATESLLRAARAPFLPERVLLQVTPDDHPLVARSPRLRQLVESHDSATATALVCRDFACRLPTSDPQALRAALGF